MSLITETILSYWQGGRSPRKTPSGWLSANAVCCHDTRSRGGVILGEGGGIAYSCFNCGFKASWQPGKHINENMKRFMSLINIDDTLISKMSLEALRIDEEGGGTLLKQIIPTFHQVSLPLDAQPITTLLDRVPDKLIPVLEYISKRGLYLEDYPFYWSPMIGFSNRLIIPFFKNHRLVGYTARTIKEGVEPRYISEQQPGYVFNLDRQHYERKFVIVCEGPFDAISIDACAILGAEIKDSQKWLLQQLAKEVILVPDHDHKGPKTVEQAIEYGWSVSMPDWPPDTKDVNDAVRKIGRLATLWLILNAKQSNPLKIRLRAKHWFRDVPEEE